MSDIFNTVTSLLKSDVRLCDNHGNLMINAVVEKANTYDESLLKSLLADERCKNIFFKKIGDVFVFLKDEFINFFSNKMLLPSSYTRFKQKIGLVDKNNDFLAKKDDVVLSFPFKDCVLEFDSTDSAKKREEVYYNEILARENIDTLFERKVFTNPVKNENGNETCTTFFDKNDNLLIKGNNLIALHSLLPVYAGEVKLMYWDILYNTNSDNVPYNDSFKHSSWLIMMKNRLEVAKKLLRDDGVIALQCDYNEMAYLKVLCDEIFGRDNFISWRISKPSATPRLFVA